MAKNENPNPTGPEGGNVPPEGGNTPPEGGNTPPEGQQGGSQEGVTPPKSGTNEPPAERTYTQADIDALKTALHKARKDKSTTPDEDVIEQAKKEAAGTVRSTLNERLLKTELKAEAKGRLQNPADAEKFLDLSQFEVDENGAVDSAALSAAIDKLLEDRPYLGTTEHRRFGGGADQGASKPARPPQLTRADLANMSPHEIVKAEAEGRLADLKGK